MYRNCETWVNIKHVKTGVLIGQIQYTVVSLKGGHLSYKDTFSLQKAIYILSIFIPLLPEGGGGYTVLPLSVRPSVHPSKIFFVAFFSVTVDGRNLIFGHKPHIGIPYRGKRFWTHQIPTSCLPTLLIFIHIEHTFCICPFLVAFFSATTDGRNLIFGHKHYIGTPYRGKSFWTHQIPTSCLPTLLIFIHIEHTFCICPFLVAFFLATIDGRYLIFGHKPHIGTPYRGKHFLTRQIPTSCLPKSGGIIGEH